MKILTFIIGLTGLLSISRRNEVQATMMEESGAFAGWSPYTGDSVDYSYYYGQNNFKYNFGNFGEHTLGLGNPHEVQQHSSLRKWPHEIKAGTFVDWSQYAKDLVDYNYFYGQNNFKYNFGEDTSGLDLVNPHEVQQHSALRKWPHEIKAGTFVDWSQYAKDPVDYNYFYGQNNFKYNFGEDTSDLDLGNPHEVQQHSAHRKWPHEINEGTFVDGSQYAGDSVDFNYYFGQNNFKYNFGEDTFGLDLVIPHEVQQQSAHRKWPHETEAGNFEDWSQYAGDLERYGYGPNDNFDEKKDDKPYSPPVGLIVDAPVKRCPEVDEKYINGVCTRVE